MKRYFRPRCWVARTVDEAIAAIDEANAVVTMSVAGNQGSSERSLHWIGQSKQRASIHLLEPLFLKRTELSLCMRLKLLMRPGILRFVRHMGIVPLCPSVVISLCSDGCVVIEYLVLCSDGSLYSRHEVLDTLPYLPTPEQIRQTCDEIRKSNPITSYNDQWVGFDGAGIREY